MTAVANRALSLDEIRRMTPISVLPEERPELLEIARALAPDAHESTRILGPKGEELTLPEPVYYLLERIVEVLASGDAVTVVPVGKLLTTQQVADVLNVSRQYVVRLLDDGKIPHRKVGKHRRCKIEDVVAYKNQRDQDRRGKLDDLTALSEEMGGYED